MRKFAENNQADREQLKNWEQLCPLRILRSVQYWPAPPTIHRGLEWPQFLNCLSVLCLFSVLIKLARSPEYPQRIRVASVFEPSA